MKQGCHKKIERWFLYKIENKSKRNKSRNNKTLKQKLHVLVESIYEKITEQSTSG